MKNRKINADKNSAGRSHGAAGEDKKIDIQKHQYPRSKKKDDQLKNQPEFIEPDPNKKGG